MYNLGYCQSFYDRDLTKKSKSPSRPAAWDVFYSLNFSEKMASQNTSESFKGSSKCDGKFGAMRCLENF